MIPDTPDMAEALIALSLLTETEHEMVLRRLARSYPAIVIDAVHEVERVPHG